MSTRFHLTVIHEPGSRVVPHASVAKAERWDGLTDDTRLSPGLPVARYAVMRIDVSVSDRRRPRRSSARRLV
eukprot:1999870-Prymnesium_polylepis.1